MQVRDKNRTKSLHVSVLSDRPCAGVAISWPKTSPIAAAEFARADVDGNCEINLTDLSVLLSYFGSPADGSLRTRYTWDAENRLIGYEPLVPTAGSRRAEYSYDSVGRRSEKRVYDWNASATPPAWNATPSESKRFVWGGWLVRYAERRAFAGAKHA